jgi:hypothetical protein
MPGLGGFEQVIKIPIYIRKEFVHHFVEQKEKEHKAMERERKKKK